MCRPTQSPSSAGFFWVKLRPSLCPGVSSSSRSQICSWKITSLHVACAVIPLCSRSFGANKRLYSSPAAPKCLPFVFDDKLINQCLVVAEQRHNPTLKCHELAHDRLLQLFVSSAFDTIVINVDCCTAQIEISSLVSILCFPILSRNTVLAKRLNLNGVSCTLVSQHLDQNEQLADPIHG